MSVIGIVVLFCVVAAMFPLMCVVLFGVLHLLLKAGLTLFEIKDAEND